MFRLIYALVKYTFVLIILLAILTVPLCFYAVRGVPTVPEARAFALCLYSMKDTYKTDWNYYSSLVTSHRSNHPIELNQEVSLFPLPSMTALVTAEKNSYKTCQTKESIEAFYRSLKDLGYKYQVSLDGRKSFESGNYRISMSFKNKTGEPYGIYTLGHSILMIGE